MSYAPEVGKTYQFVLCRAHTEEHNCFLHMKGVCKQAHGTDNARQVNLLMHQDGDLSVVAMNVPLWHLEEA